MSIKISHVFTYVADAEIVGKRLSRLLKQSMKATGERSMRPMVARRFTPIGGRELHYKRRSAAYVADKSATKGHRNPYVWSGETKREAKSGATMRASAKKFTLRIPFDATKMAALRRKGIAARIEMKEVGKKELEQFARKFRDELTARINKLRSSRTKRVKE